ncbi:hypothetical protein E6H36_06095 [Candidatus Bathyarchaeota archaeon]|nr:MAG: hypothetical protein E6H36_06095 [Candidatus Bathyarchaeota archaeon]TMI29853.1 MAG: hypothetical protein E6H29_09770 [Candidatus Bathyarchaeota archaeon]
MSEQTSLQTSEGSHPSGTLEITVRHQGVENKIIGTPDGVIRELLSYFSKVYPSLELTSKLVLTVDNAEFLQSVSGTLASSQEGLVVLKEVSGLRDKELMMLHLAGAKLLNLLGKKDNDNISLDEITKATGRSTGTVAGRLSELCNEQLVERVGKGSYRLTTMGARVVIKNVMPKTASFPDR